MADEVLKRDSNAMVVAAGVTDDSNQFITMFRIDPVTKRLKISATVTGVPTGSGTTNEIAYWTSASALGSLTTATYPSLTELSYVKGVTSAIQTQLDNKQATLVSGTNIKTINGNSLLGSGDLVISAGGLTVGTTTITSGTTTRVLYNNAGVLGEYTITGTGSVVMSTSPTIVTPTVAQLNGTVIRASGSGGIDIENNSGTDVAIFGAGGGTGTSLTGTTNIGSASADYFQMAGGTGTITNTATGSSTNININLVPKGTGRLQAGGVTVPTISSSDALTNKTYNGLTITTSTGTLTVTNGKTVAFSNSITFAGTDSTTMTFPTTTATIARTDAAQTFTGTQTFGVIQPSTIELGNASDTTLARVSAGVVSIEGVTILTTATGLQLSGGTMTGSITLGENATIALDPAGSADGKYTGITVTGVAGYAQTYGDLVYLSSVDSRWELADADAASTADRMLAMVVVAGGSDGAACTLLLKGIIRADAKFPALTIGSPVYVGETAGAIQVAIPTGADNVIRRVGFALTADEIYFNPSMDSQTTVA